MKVGSLRYGIIFKKAFSVPETFTAFVDGFTGVRMKIDKVVPRAKNPQNNLIFEE